MTIAFVDDTGFYTNRSNYQKKIQAIVEEYTKLYKATGEKVEQTKSFYYTWKWIFKLGKL